MRDVFKQGVQVAYKRHRNIKEFLCRARLYTVTDRRNPPRMAQSGWKCCNKCSTCLHSRNQTEFTFSATKEAVTIQHHLTCKTSPVIYMVQCTRCPSKPQYIGKTRQSLMVRGRQHLNNIEKRRQDSKSTSKMYAHFSSREREIFITAQQIFAIEQIFGDDFVSSTRERMFIDKGDTIRNGLNTYRT